MQYRKFGKTGVEVSALGFGTMRLPLVNPEDSSTIDEARAIRMLRDAVDAGLNYIDTAYPYHMRMSETLVGKALQDGYREKVYLATKSPVWLLEKPEDFDRILDEQLEKLQTDHIDFYLLHALSQERWENVVVKLGLLERAEKAKEAGKIRHIGFSFHDGLPAFKTIVDGYDKWDFCQIQYNYINTDYQAGAEGLHYAASKGLGVIIMEPLLGGRLADPPQAVKDVLPDTKSPVEWGLDYLWNQPEVSLLLSGMSTEEQAAQNLEYASRSSVGMLSEEEAEMFEQAKLAYDGLALVPCTKCKYCMPCPFGLDIPGTFEAYNALAYETEESARKRYGTLEKKADACRACHHCEKECPQHIGISSLMPEIAKKLG